MVFISCYHTERAITESSLAKEFNLKLGETKKMIEDLYEHGLINREKNGVLSTKEWFYIPLEKEFDSLRDQNFERAYKQFWKIPAQDRFRTTITRLVSPQQQRELESLIGSLINQIVDFDDSDATKARPFTMAVFASPRKFGNQEAE